MPSTAAATMEVFLALTGGCAVCHDHKFDPISAKDFYSLYAFFYSIDGPAMDGNALLTAPTIKTPSKDQDKKLADLNARIAKLQSELGEKTKTLKYEDPADLPPEATKFADDPARSFKAWRAKIAKDNKGLPKEIVALIKQAKAKSADETKLRLLLDERVCRDKACIRCPDQAYCNDDEGARRLNGAIPGSFVFRIWVKPRDSFVMRGQYTKPGEKVEPNTPSFLPPMKKAGARATRLDLAKWLTSPENPMTARVAVNRYWQQFFGTGLVKSSGDFGAQGELPSHPELLDWLAISFSSPLTSGGEGPGVRGPSNAWDLKSLVRLMLTSQTFRQSARVTPDLLKRDPENRLYARGPRFRLDAEQIRDNTLFTSGLMVLDAERPRRQAVPTRADLGPVAFSGSNTGNYVQDKGVGLYPTQHLHLHQARRASLHVEL